MKFAKFAAAGIVGVTMALSASMSARAADIVDTAVAAGSFKTLVAAVQAAGLVETLKGAGPFTVFAPTDEAFAALPAGTVEDLLKPENKDKLVAILTYHVVPGKVMSTDLKDNTTAKTVQGGESQDRPRQRRDDQRREGRDRRRCGRQRRHPCHRQGDHAGDVIIGVIAVKKPAVETRPVFP